MIDISKLRIAVLIPCLNEQATIERVVLDFKRALPTSTIYVFDNNSTDNSVEIAKATGAIIHFEHSQGKGHVVRRMFSDIDADIYLMTDGDDTYDASISPLLIEKLVSENCDLVNCARAAKNHSAYRFGHSFGNRMISKLVRIFFKSTATDILSGYKVFSRRFVKSFPVLSNGFEIETEIMIHALSLKIPYSEMSGPYKERPLGSESKLKTYRDGFRILGLIGFLLKEEKPFVFFGLIALLLLLISAIFGAPIIIHYFETGLVPRLPTAVLAAGLSILSMLSLAIGLILDAVCRGRREIKRLAYLSQKLFT